jgi:hypothetical protein
VAKVKREFGIRVNNMPLYGLTLVNSIELGLTQEQIYQFLQSAGGVGSVTLSSDGDDHATVTITARDNADEPALDSELLRALKEVVNEKSVSGKLWSRAVESTETASQ